MILRSFGPYIVEQAPEGFAILRDGQRDRRAGLVFAAVALAFAGAAYAGEAPLPFVAMLSISALFALLRAQRAGRPAPRLFLSRDGARYRSGDPSDDLVWPKSSIRRVCVEEGRTRALRHNRQAGPHWYVSVEVEGVDDAPKYFFASRTDADEMAAFMATELGVSTEK